MADVDGSLSRLLLELDALTADEGAEVLAQALADARARVRSLLADALEESLLDAVLAELDRRHPATSAVVCDEYDDPAAEDDRGWYVYGVVRPDSPLAGAENLIVLEEGDIAAIACRVPFEEFDETQLRANLSDMDWVERTARAHESVLDEIRVQTTVIPMRMCTVYRTEGGVREMLRRESDPLAHALDTLAGKTEWGVKVFASPERVRDAADTDGAGGFEPDGAGTPGAGAAYMHRRQRERGAAERAAETIERSAARIHERLCAVAVDGLVAPSQRPQCSHDGEMALNGVYLVEDAEQERFDAEVKALNTEHEPLGFELEVSGPWPAYNFVPGSMGVTW